MRILGRHRSTAIVLASFLTLAAAENRAHVSLDRPDGGESFTGGSPELIQWHIVIAHNTLNWDLWYSVSGAGGPWIEIAVDIPPGDISTGALHEYSWTVPEVNTTRARVRVRMDNSSTDYTDISAADFTITSSQPLDSGACCLSDGSCLVTDTQSCGAASGVYQGDGTSCNPNPCPQPPDSGACCLTDGSCLVLTLDDCGLAGGTYQGDNTDCQPNPCPPPECCIGDRGDVNSDGGVDVADLTYLVDYLFGGGPPPPCLKEADLDGSGGVDVSDLTYLVDYLFGGGPAPVACS